MKFEDRPFISIDLGTSNIIAYVAKQGIIYNEPSVLAYDIMTNKLLAMGQEAYEMIGKTPDMVRMVVPINEGTISDFDAAKELIKNVFGKINMTNKFKDAVVLLACPSDITELERAALKEIAVEMGASFAIVEEEVLMAAIGAGLNIDSPSGHIVIDIGGGTTDIAIIASGSIIYSKSIKMAGKHFDEEIRKYIRSEYNIQVGEISSERIKKEIASLQKIKDERSIPVFGRDIISGLPKEAKVSSEEIRNVMVSSFAKITDTVISLLELSPPELAGDIIKNGMIVCGGGALIKGVDKYFEDIFSLPCKKAKNPLECVIEGTKQYQKVINKRYEQGYYGKANRIERSEFIK
ncbi:rod shape-determining protein [Spiroplasma endosymbiont of Labia minor]|uniref:rod shape-determining protein n=1 Tax=Spiroplasma endosymbiont of Labia minor TaxID=3066305 RepID=UPI0030CB33B8